MEVRASKLLAFAAGLMIMCGVRAAEAQWSPDHEGQPGAQQWGSPAPASPGWGAPAANGWGRPGATVPGGDHIELDDGKGQERRKKTAAAMTGLSGGVLAASLVTYLVSRGGEEACGVTGCFNHPNEKLEVASLALLGAGGGMALVAVPTLLDAMFVERGAPREAGRMGWGMALTTVGVGSAASIGMLALSLSRIDARIGVSSRQPLPNRVDDDAIITMMVVQGLSTATHLGVGIPLWAKGGRSHPDRSGSDWMGEINLVPTGNGIGVTGSF